MEAQIRLKPVLLVAAVIGLAAPATAQNPDQVISCRDLPCTVVVDWTHEGGAASQGPDRRYGQPTYLEQNVKGRLVEHGLESFTGAEGLHLRIVLIPTMGNAMCDEMAGTATQSCRAIRDVQVRIEGPDDLREDVDIPSRIRNRCASDKVMAVAEFGAFVGDWIYYGLEGKAKDERRPVARC